MPKSKQNGAITHLGDLRPDPANRRKRTSRNLGMIADSLQQVGAARSIVIDEENVILAGNGVWEAAGQVGIERVRVVDADGEEIIAVRRTGLSPEQKRFLGLYDNRAAELAEWDTDQLLADLNAGLSFEGLWDKGELDALLASVTQTSGLQPGTDPDAVPPSAPARCARGEVWELGRHRLAVGDCREAETWERLLGGEPANVVFTSPPYASQRKYDEESGFTPIPPDGYVEWWDAVQANARNFLAADGSFFVNIKEHCEDGQRSLYVKDLTIAHVRRWGWRFVEEYCWRRKPFPGDMGPRFKNAWEPVLHFSQGAPKFNPGAVAVDGVTVEYSAGNGLTLNGEYRGHHPNHGLIEGKARPSNVIDCSAEGENPGHGARFPVALPDFFIRAFSDEGDIILDPFLGSGSTLMAAEQTGRRGFGIELSAKYCDIALLRWEAATGQQARRVE